MLHKDFYEFFDFAHIFQLQRLFDTRLQKRLLGLGPAQIAVGIAGHHAVSPPVIVAVADHAHGLFSIEDLKAFLQMNVQVLIRIVVVHIAGYIEFHATQGIYQLTHGFPLNEHIEIRHDAGQIADLLFQIFQAAAAGFLGTVYRVDLFDGPGNIHSRIPGNTHHVHLLIRHIIGNQNNGICTAAGGIFSQQKERIVPVLPSAGSTGFIAFLCVSVDTCRLAASARTHVMAHVRRSDQYLPQPHHKHSDRCDAA